jgi:transposase
LARLPAGLWPLHDHLQSLQSLEPAGHLDRHLLRADEFDRHDRNGGGRLDAHQGAPLGRRRKRGAFQNAIGRSRGGRTTKIHALTDGHGKPLAFQLTPGNAHDLEGARALLAVVPCPSRLIADRAYDARSLRHWLAERGAEAVIPPNPTRKHPSAYDASAYKSRNSIERMFCRLKDFRRIATRYDKLARNFLAGVLIAAAITWWIN